MPARSACLVSGRGRRLFCTYWEPDQEPRALVFICHGYAEHCLSYEPLAEKLVSNKCLVFAHDHVGYGQSEGARALIDSFDTYVEDVLHHVDQMHGRHPGLPIFLCGHSMGGAISILSGLRKPDIFKGIVLIGPAVATDPEVATPFIVAVAKALRRLMPRFPLTSLPMHLVTRNTEVLERLERDPLRYHGRAKAGFGGALLEACQSIETRLEEVRFPFLVVQGGEDKLCAPKGARMLYQKASSTDKTLKIYPEAYHQLLYEPDGIAEEATTEIIDWITARC